MENESYVLVPVAIAVYEVERLPQPMLPLGPPAEVHRAPILTVDRLTGKGAFLHHDVVLIRPWSYDELQLSEGKLGDAVTALVVGLTQTKHKTSYCPQLSTKSTTKHCQAPCRVALLFRSPERGTQSGCPSEC